MSRPKQFKTPEGWGDRGYYTGDHAAWHPPLLKEELGTLQEGEREYWPIDSIDPGELSEEFGLISHEGLPAVVEWRVIGWSHVAELVGDEIRVPIWDYKTRTKIKDLVYKADDWGDTILDHSETLPNSDPSDNMLVGKTLGPGAPPPTDPDVLADTFISGMIHQVLEGARLGWMSKDGKQPDDDSLPGVAKSIIQKLEKVRQNAMRGKFSTARQILRGLINEANAQRGKHLTEEAYVLIKFSAEFLLEKF